MEEVPKEPGMKILMIPSWDMSLLVLSVSFMSFPISGRIEIIAEFEGLIYSFPEEMCSMQNQFSRFKEDASDVHSLRADVKSLAHILDRKVGFLLLAVFFSYFFCFQLLLMLVKSFC